MVHKGGYLKSYLCEITELTWNKEMTEKGTSAHQGYLVQGQAVVPLHVPVCHQYRTQVICVFALRGFTTHKPLESRFPVPFSVQCCAYIQ